jgi:hypothetical protein
VDEAFEQLMGFLPAWLVVILAVALVAVGIIFGARMPAWLVAVVVAARMAALRRLLRRVRLPSPEPHPDYPSDDGRPPDMPPAPVVDGNGDPVQLGRTDQQIEDDERRYGSGG